MTQGPARSALYEGRVWHRRFKPRTHKLAYRIFMLLVDLDEAAARRPLARLLSFGRFNLLDVRGRDHLAGSAEPLKMQVEAMLQQAGFETGGRVRLLCMPRVLGGAFNPLSVYFCETAAGRLQAILYEVNNTFGQRHSYLLAVEGEGDVRQGVRKGFYVSPFNGLDMRYDFRVVAPGERSDESPLSIVIDVSDAEGLLMTAGFVGARQALSDGSILRAFVRHPLLMAKVVGGIHWEALKLWLKGMKLVPRPPAPTTPVTVVR